MNKLIVIVLLFCGVLNASDPYGWGNNPVTRFSWGGLAFSGAKMAFNALNDNKTAIVCSTVTKAVQFEQNKIEHDAEKAGLIAENTELKNHVKILREAVEMNSKSMINAYERLEESKKFSDELFKHIENQDKQYKEALQAKKAVDSLGKVQLHMLAAYEQSENKAGYFTERHNRFNQNQV